MFENLMTQPQDIGSVYEQFTTLWFNADQLIEFDPKTNMGRIRYKRYRLKPRMAFNIYDGRLEEDTKWEFPAEYPSDPELDFYVIPVSPRCVRLIFNTRDDLAMPPMLTAEENPMLISPFEPSTDGWEVTKELDSVVYQSEFASLVIRYDPFVIEWRDADGTLLTQTNHMANSKCLAPSRPTPFGFARDIQDLSRVFCSSWSLAPCEKLYGLGESFSRLDKRGARHHLSTIDAHGVSSQKMYKPVPFMLSSRGYGMFHHTGARMSWDIGHFNDNAAINFLDESRNDLFLYAGQPAQVIQQHTRLTGRSTPPPLWSLGLWMSRITYKSETEVREVAENLKKHKVPCDVIHLDTGWFETDWRCDYKFSTSRFDDPEKMFADLKDMGYRCSVWQLPYFIPTNPLFKELVEKGLAIKDSEGGLPTEDAILDFTNPNTVHWYKQKIAQVLKMGTVCIKADFGESAPIHGRYANGRGGKTEHNLYPLRYNKAVSEITREICGHDLIFARSAWVGSQRYATHWGGDAENTDNGMLSSLRGGLSLGVCGFSFWSHDIGGFARASEPELYLRWLFFGVFSSHSRCHGAPPKEPWSFDEAFLDQFRKMVELKYQLMPYVYTECVEACAQGLPLVRPLYLEYPEDPIAWQVEDAYMFGRQLLIAPLFEKGITERDVYLPAGQWYDLFTGQEFTGGTSVKVTVGDLPGIALVKSGSAIATVKPALTTDELNFDEVTWWLYGKAACEGNWVKPHMITHESPGPLAMMAQRVRFDDNGKLIQPDERKAAWQCERVSMG